MKLLIASLSLVLSSPAIANTYTDLKRVSCVASNGTTIETLGRRNGNLVVATRLGLLTKNFEIALVVDEETERTTVELTDETGRIAYLLDLTVDLTTRKEQTRFGSVIRTGDGYVAPAVVATTLCDLTLK